METADRIQANHRKASELTAGRQARRLGALALSASILGLAALPMHASAYLRPGDIGFSIRTSAGNSWIYGDSWNNGQFIRNAITLNGRYVGTIRGVSSSHWVWPGAPFKLSDGRISLYGGEATQVKPGIWGFKLVGGVKATFDPTNASAAKVSQLAPGSRIWAAASAEDSQGTLVYAIDSNHHAHAGRPQPDGSVTEVSSMGGTISGQFSVVPDSTGKWWMVGQLPFLSRRVVAYPLSGPAGKVTGPAIKLITLPSPGPNRFTYAATIHPEIDGLMTYAVNGSGPGTPYGLQRSPQFWPYTLGFAQAAAAAPAGAQPLVAAAARVARSIATVAASTVGGDRVKLWPTEKQKDLESELKRRDDDWNGEDWLGSKPTDLSPGMSPSASAPSVWEHAETGAKQPEGEDNDRGSEDFLIPATARGLKAQQAAAQAAITLATAQLELATAQLQAALAAERAAAAAAKANERLLEAQKDSAEAQGPAAIAAAKQAERDAKAAAAASERAAELAREQAAEAVSRAKEALKRATAAAKKANGKGRKSWD